MRRVSLILILTIGWLSFPFAAEASPRHSDHCVCQNIPSIAEAFAQAPAVFTGLIVERSRPNEVPFGVELINRVPGIELGGYSVWRATVAVETSWKSVTESSVVIRTPFGVDCGVRFVVGDRYLIYAFPGRAGLETNQCLGSTELTQATLALKFLQAKPTLQIGWPLFNWLLLLGVGLTVLGLTWIGGRWLRRELVK